MNHRIAAICMALGLLSVAGSARADNLAPSEAVFKKAVEDYVAGNFPAACAGFAESYRLAARPGPLFAQAECEAARGNVATAATLYGDFLRSVTKEQQTKYREQLKEAKTKKEKLAKDIPHLTLALSASAPADTVVTWDGQPLAAASLGIAIPADPGEHVITMQAPGGELKEVRVTLGLGKNESAEIDPPLPPPPPVVDKQKDVPPPSPDQRKAQFRTIAFVAGGVGVAGMIAGGVLGGLALQKKSIIEDHCNDLVCDKEGIAAARQAQPLGLVSTIGFGVGIAGVATGAVMFMMSRGGKAKDQGKSTTHVGVLEAGPMGAVFGVKGAF